MIPVGDASDADRLGRLRHQVRTLRHERDLADVVAWLGDVPVVLLGEATHGTHEFYAFRAQLTRELIERRGFTGVAIEGDWPDAYQVNRYVTDGGGGARGYSGAEQALGGFRRFPTWMWRNLDVLAFVDWLQRRNAGHEPRERAGFYGMDLYSLHASMQSVIDYLQPRDPAAARAARESYACFDQFGAQPDTYAWATARLGQSTCEDAVTRQLLLLHERRTQLAAEPGTAAGEAYFSAEQNARLARNAERYYRSLFGGRAASWYVRDEHMAETVGQLRDHLRILGREPRLVIWAHNSHLGDARATEMGWAGGEFNVGQLLRESLGRDVRSIGFTTHGGTVMAASDWGEAPERKRVRPSLPGSYEDLFHQLGEPRFFLPTGEDEAVQTLLSSHRLERAIGVVYRPETERHSHYFEANLAAQFDAVVHFEQTTAVEPLERAPLPDETELPETFPSGF